VSNNSNKNVHFYITFKYLDLRWISASGNLKYRRWQLKFTNHIINTKSTGFLIHFCWMWLIHGQSAMVAANNNLIYNNVTNNMCKQLTQYTRKNVYLHVYLSSIPTTFPAYITHSYMVLYCTVNTTTTATTIYSQYTGQAALAGTSS